MSVFDLDDEFMGARTWDDPDAQTVDTSTVPSGPRTDPQTIEKIFVDTEEGLTQLLDEITSLGQDDARQYIDLEGDNLCRHGTIAIMQMYVPATGKVYLLDVHTLGRRSFEVTTTDKSATLKDILEDVAYTKAFFDLRNDSDALFGLYQIRLRGVEDVQLMAYADYRSDDDDWYDYQSLPSDYLRGLQRCIEQDAMLDPQTLMEWKETKQYGKELFRDKDFSRFAVRPLDEQLQTYCINDVRWLPRLRDMYWEKLNPRKRKKVIFETENRVRESQADEYVQHGAWGPHAWNKYGDKAWPLASRKDDMPQWPDCYCGRYQGLRHHCEEQCRCFEVCCRWWIERAPPREGKPPGPKYDPKWGYNIPRNNLIGKLLHPADATRVQQHLDKAMAEYRERAARATTSGGGAPRAQEETYGDTMLCRDRHWCRPDDDLHTGRCLSRNGLRLSAKNKEEWKMIERDLWKTTPPKRNAWADSAKVGQLKSSLQKH